MDAKPITFDSIVISRVYLCACCSATACNIDFVSISQWQYNRTIAYIIATKLVLWKRFVNRFTRARTQKCTKNAFFFKFETTKCFVRGRKKTESDITWSNEKLKQKKILRVTSEDSHFFRFSRKNMPTVYVLCANIMMYICSEKNSPRNFATIKKYNNLWECGLNAVWLLLMWLKLC